MSTDSIYSNSIVPLPREAGCCYIGIGVVGTLFFAFLSLSQVRFLFLPPMLLFFSEIELRAVDQAVGLVPHALALLAPFFFGLCTWRMEAHVQTHPGKALPLTASQLVVVAVTSALFGVISGGEESGEK